MLTCMCCPALLPQALKPGVLAPPPAATASSRASSTSGDTAAAVPAAADPFADLFGGLGSGSAPAIKPAPAPPAPAASSGGPMRPQQPAPAPAMDLLSGWDEFEALFAAGPKPAAAQQAGGAAGATVGAGAFEVSFPPPPPPVTAAPPPPATAAAAPPPGKSGSVVDAAPAAAKKAAEEGLKAFAAGKWEEAAKKLAKALDKASGDAAFTQQARAAGGSLRVGCGCARWHAGATCPPPACCPPPDPRPYHHLTPLPACSHSQAVALFVAARLLGAGAKKPAPAAARLARFAAALPLEDAARVAAVAAAVDANMAAKNFGYAADQLTWLVIRCTEGGAGTALSAADLQDKLNACGERRDRLGPLQRVEAPAACGARTRCAQPAERRPPAPPAPPTHACRPRGRQQRGAAARRGARQLWRHRRLVRLARRRRGLGGGAGGGGLRAAGRRPPSCALRHPLCAAGAPHDGAACPLRARLSRPSVP